MNSCGRKSASVCALGQADLLQEAAVLRALGSGAVPCGEQLGDLEAQVVPGGAVAATRVSESRDEDVHDARPRSGERYSASGAASSAAAASAASASLGGRGLVLGRLDGRRAGDGRDHEIEIAGAASGPRAS